MNQVVNKGNRFGVVIKVEDSEMLRAAQSYITLVDSLGFKNEVLPEAFGQGLAYVAKERPEYTQETESNMSVNRALEIVSKWLERVATRDPQLFKTFVGKIKKLEDTKPVPAKKPVETKSEKAK
jgi:hypothetical protein